MNTPIPYTHVIAFFALAVLLGIGFGIAIDRLYINRRNRRVTRPSILFRP